MEPAPSPRRPARCSARRRASAASNTAANASAVAPSPASCALRVHLSHSCTAAFAARRSRGRRRLAPAAAREIPAARARARRRRRPIPLRQVPPDSSAAADGVRTELRERGDDALFDPRQCRVVSTGSGGGRGFPRRGRTRFPRAASSPSAPRPPVLPRGYPTTFRVRLFRADRPGDSRSVTLDDPRSVSPRLFFERALEPVGERVGDVIRPRVRQQRNERGDERRPRRDARAKRAHSRRAKRLSHRALARLRRRRRRARQRVPAATTASTDAAARHASAHAANSASNVSRSRASDGVTPGAFPTRSRNVTAMCARHIRAGNVAAEDSAATARSALIAARLVAIVAAGDDERVAHARAVDGARNPVAACGLRRRACVVSLHAAVASAAAASAPPTSTIRPTSGASAREDEDVDVVVVARAAAALEAVPVDLCGGVSGPPSAAHMRLSASRNEHRTMTCPCPPWWPPRQLCAEDAKRVACTSATSSTSSATPTKSAANAPGSPALDSWLINWHSVHTMVSVTFSLGGEESEGGPGQKRWHPSEGRGVPRSARVGKREVGGGRTSGPST